MGGKRINEIYMGSKKIYPIGVNMMRLREIIEDDARQYGDAGGIKYNWYVWFAGDSGDVYDTFGEGDRTLQVRIFCDYHPPHNGKYYDRDFSKPVGYANYGDVYKQTIDGIDVEMPRMRVIWFTAQTKEKEPYLSTLYVGYAVNPEWEQGHFSPDGPYWHPGESLIWTGWQWWLYQNSDHIYKYDFIKREFGPELTGADLWVPIDPYDPDS